MKKAIMEEKNFSKISFWYMILPLALAQLIDAYDITSISVAISKIIQSLNTSVQGIQAAITISSLVMAAFMILGGKLVDTFGTKKTFLIGMFLYCLGTLITAFSPNISLMILGWSIIKSIGAILMIPATIAMIGIVLPNGKTRTKGYALIAISTSIGAAFGPFLCGLLSTYSSWRLSFLLEAIVAIIVIMMMQKIIRVTGQDIKNQSKSKIDIFGTILSAIGISFIVLGFLCISTYGLISSRIPVKLWTITIIEKNGISPVMPLVSVGIVVLIAFVLWENYIKNKNKTPLVDISLFKIKGLSWGLIIDLFISFVTSGILFIFPVLLQMDFGLSPIVTGMFILPCVIFTVVSAFLSPGLGEKFGQRRLIVIGSFVIPLACIYLSLAATSYISFYWEIPGLILLGIGSGLIEPTLMNVIQSSTSSGHQGEVSGINKTAATLGNSLGTAIAGGILITVLLTTASSMILESKIIPNQDKSSIIEYANNQIETVSDEQMKQKIAETNSDAIKDEELNINRLSRNNALVKSIFIIGLIGFAGFLASLMLPRIKKLN